MIKKYCGALALLLLLSFSQVYAQRPTSATDVRPLLVGAAAPEIAGLVDAEGTAFDLKSAWAKGPAVLVFYRGHW